MVPSFIETQDIWEINLPSKLFSGRGRKEDKKEKNSSIQSIFPKWEFISISFHVIITKKSRTFKTQKTLGDLD